MAEINNSIVNVVLFVSLGVLVFIMVFCFAKRQISRFALKSSKSVHETIGHHAPKTLLLEIERRLRRVKDISIEPHLVPPGRRDELKRRAKIDPDFHYYRMQTLDSVCLLYDEIRRCNPGAVKRVGMPLRVFLFEQRQVGCLEGIRLEVIEKLCTFYDQARHDPKPFSKNHNKEFQSILRLLLHYIHNKYKVLQRQTPSPTGHSEQSTNSHQHLLPSTPSKNLLSTPSKNLLPTPSKNFFSTPSNAPSKIRPNNETNNTYNKTNNNFYSHTNNHTNNNTNNSTTKQTSSHTNSALLDSSMDGNNDNLFHNNNNNNNNNNNSSDSPHHHSDDRHTRVSYDRLVSSGWCGGGAVNEAVDEGVEGRMDGGMNRGVGEGMDGGIKERTTVGMNEGRMDGGVEEEVDYRQGNELMQMKRKKMC